MHMQTHTHAHQEGLPIYSPSFYRDITLKQLSDIFRSETQVPIPLLEQRRDNLHEAAAVLADKFGGKVSELICQSEKSAEKLVSLLANNFRSYRDVATYNGRTGVHLKATSSYSLTDVCSCMYVYTCSGSIEESSDIHSRCVGSIQSPRLRRVQ